VAPPTRISFGAKFFTGTLPVEQTKDRIATKGPAIGPHGADTTGWSVKKNAPQLSDTPARSAAVGTIVGSQAVCPVIFIDAVHVEIRDGKVVDRPLACTCSPSSRTGAWPTCSWSSATGCSVCTAATRVRHLGATPWRVRKSIIAV
jgi:hypothetical protein